MVLTKEEAEFLDQQQKEMLMLKADSQMKEFNSAQQVMDMQNQNQNLNLLKEQLDLAEELDKIDKLLRGQIIKQDEKGNAYWASPEDDDLIILTEAGINYVNWVIQWYLTKNTLLSNYDVDTINKKMEDLSKTISDNLFMKYNVYFKQPTLEDCKKEIKERIKRKVDLRKFASELAGESKEESEIRKEVIMEMEGRIERELIVIKEQKNKEKLKMYESLIRFIQDTIHSAYLRAYGGQERRTLRQHIHISENVGQPTIQQKPKKLNILNYGG